MPILFWAVFFSFVASIFINVAKVIVAVIKVVVPIIARVFEFAGRALVRVGQAFGRFARTIAGAAKAFVDHVVKPVIDAVSKFFQKIERFLDRVTAPIRRIIERINRALDWVWTKIVSPILDVIEKVRAVLRLLAELGAGWAARLDRILQQIESRIYDTFREVRSWVNTFELWLDILLDPGGWIHSTPFLYTVFKWSGNIWGIMVNLGLDPHASEGRALTRQENPLRPVSSTVERFRTGYYRDHPGVQGAIARFRTAGRFGK
jgi:hypothetical protein